MGRVKSPSPPLQMSISVPRLPGKLENALMHRRKPHLGQTEQQCLAGYSKKVVARKGCQTPQCQHSPGPTLRPCSTPISCLLTLFREFFFIYVYIYIYIYSCCESAQQHHCTKTPGRDPRQPSVTKMLLLLIS